MIAEEIVGKLTVQDNGWAAKFNRAAGAVTAFGSKAGAGATSAKKMGDSMRAAGAGSMAMRVGILGAITAVGAFAVASVRAYDQAVLASVKLQRATGGTIEEVSGLAGAGKLVGVETDQLQRSVGLLSKKMVAAQSDTAKTAELTKLLGTSFLDAEGHIRPMTSMLPEIATKFQQMANGPEKVGLALQLFGRSGQQMLPLLNQGAAGMAALTARAEELGVVISQEQVAEWGKYRTALKESGLAMQGMQMQLGNALLPAVTAGMSAITHFASAMQNIPGPVKTAAIAVAAFAAASMLIGPRLSYAITAFQLAGHAAVAMAGKVRAAMTTFTAITSGTLAANAAMEGLATATGAASTGTAAVGMSAAATAGVLAGAAAVIGLASVAAYKTSEAFGGLAGALVAVGSQVGGPIALFAAMKGAETDFVNETKAAGLTVEMFDQKLAGLVASGHADQAAAMLGGMLEGLSGDDIQRVMNGLTQYRGALDGTADAMTEAAAAAQELATKLQSTSILSAQQNQVAFTQSIRSLRTELEESNNAFGKSDQGLANRSTALQMALSANQAYESSLTQMTEAGLAGSAMETELTASYVKQMTALGQLIPKTAEGKAMIEGLNQMMANVPGWVPINIKESGGAAAKASLSSLISTARGVPKQLLMRIQASGQAPTFAAIKQLGREIGATPKQIKVVMELLGIDKTTKEGEGGGKKVSTSFAKGIKSGWPGAKSAGQGAGKQAAQAASAQASAGGTAGQQVGSAIVQGLTGAINAGASQVASAAAAMVTNAMNAARAAAQVSSPSKKSAKIGRQIAQGMEVGIKKDSKRVARASARMTYDSADAARKAAEEAAARDRREQKKADKMNYPTKAAKKKGKSTGKGDKWLAGQQAARDWYAEAEREAQERADAEARIVAETARINARATADAFTAAGQAIQNSKLVERAKEAAQYIEGLKDATLQYGSVMGLDLSPFTKSMNEQAEAARRATDWAAKLADAQERAAIYGSTTGNLYERARALQDIETATRELAAAQAVAAGGGASAVLTADTVINDMKARLEKAQKFAAIVEDLRSKGLNSASMKEILAAGADQGALVGQALLDQGQAAIDQVNQLEAALTTAGNAIGDTGGMAEFGMNAGTAQAIQNVTVNANLTINAPGVSAGDRAELERLMQEAINRVMAEAAAEIAALRT